MTIRKHEGFLDFTNPSATTLSMIIRAKRPIEGKTIGRIFWVYSTRINKAARPFQLTDIDGKVYNLETLKGKVAVFNFWGISCSPCIREIPYLNRLVQQYKHRNDVVFIALSPDKKEELSKFLDKTSFNYQHVINKDNGRLRISILEYQGIFDPSHAVLNKEGEIVFQYLGGHPNIAKMISTAIDRDL